MWQAVPRQPSDYRLPSAILRLPPRITDQLQDSRMLCFCLLLRFYVLVPFPRVDNSHSLYIVVHLALI